MRIDCSKEANIGDLVAIVGVVILFGCLAVIGWSILQGQSFFAGFMSATLIWKWHRWVFVPLDTLANRYWPVNDK